MRACISTLHTGNDHDHMTTKFDLGANKKKIEGHAADVGLEFALK